MSNTELFKKVYIKTLDDLPKEDGEYFVFVKGGVGMDVYEYYKGASDHEYWLETFDWYLQPLPQSKEEEIKPDFNNLISMKTGKLKRRMKTAEEILNNNQAHTYPTGHILSGHRFYDANTVLKAMEEYKNQSSPESVTDSHTLPKDNHSHSPIKR